MSITDELREWGSRWEDAVAREVSEIADRIDAEHRAALEKVAATVDEPDEKRRAYYDRFIAPMVDGCPLEVRVERIERLLNHKGA